MKQTKYERTTRFVILFLPVHPRTSHHLINQSIQRPLRQDASVYHQKRVFAYDQRLEMFLETVEHNQHQLQSSVRAILYVRRCKSIEVSKDEMRCPDHHSKLNQQRGPPLDPTEVPQMSLNRHSKGIPHAIPIQSAFPYTRISNFRCHSMDLQPFALVLSKDLVLCP